MIDWVKSLGVSIVAIENLKFARSHDTNKEFNRKTSMFAYSQMVAYITSRCYKENLELRVVDPKYTSLIGSYKYADTYGLSVHQSAALVIARRCLGLKEKPTKKLFTAVKALTSEETPLGGKDFWSCLYGLDKRDSNRVPGDVLSIQSKRKTVNPSDIGVRTPDPLAMTVNQGPTLELVGTEDPESACIAFDRV